MNTDQSMNQKLTRSTIFFKVLHGDSVTKPDYYFCFSNKLWFDSIDHYTNTQIITLASNQTMHRLQTVSSYI